MKSLLLLPLLAATALTSASPPTAHTKNGTYLGRQLPSFAQDLFLNIPYAHSPRLRNPIPLLTQSWPGLRSAEYYGPICPNFASAANMARANVTGMDDECLNLNVIRPSDHRGEALPVVVWLYGGGFVDGFGADLNSNTSWLVQASVAQGQPVMAVTLNYRVGFFGFPSGPEAAREGVTNLGLKDQRMALRWVRENIAAFGGDPGKVTLWGQSAGACSIAYHLMHPDRGEKLFDRGVLVSSSTGLGNGFGVDGVAERRTWERVVNASGCATLECMRGMGREELRVAASGGMPVLAWWPSVDGETVVGDPTVVMGEGGMRADVPVMVGENSDEGFVLTNNGRVYPETEEELRAALKGAFGRAGEGAIEELLRVYPEGGPVPPYALGPGEKETTMFCDEMDKAGLKCSRELRRLAGILGDNALSYGRRLMMRKLAEKGGRVWSWRFDTWPTGFPIEPQYESAPGFAMHGADYAYHFGFPRDYELYGNNPPVADVPAHRALSKAMVARLIAFIHSGDPNKVPGTKAIPHWPQYSVKNPKNMVWNATSTLNVHVEDDTFRKEGFDIWTKYPLELSYTR
ncbi:Alpha/Beta hydrolase protein [Schizothecium vesticola]|uniref:Carboxylic ester hydrolase n=1 Tax=Schizothecium vesticola TaxID=314040 RepID=A0AA40F3P4_9PEZI|nr:Alpha/Beta hydrolase protein [Schizothecium vesticola]